jgi:hypothetical protein
MIEDFLALQTGEQIGLALALFVVIACLLGIIWSAWCEVCEMCYPPELLDTSAIVEQAGIRRELSPSRNMEGAARTTCPKQFCRHATATETEGGHVD